jgi:hypothetical protein
MTEAIKLAISGAKPVIASANPLLVDAMIVQLEMVSRSMGNGVPEKVTKSFTAFLGSLKEWSAELKEGIEHGNAAKSA